MNKFNKTAVILFCALLAGCSPNPKTPEGLLKMYVNDITSKKVDKEYYQKFTAGELLESSEKLGEVEYEENARAHKLKEAKIKILNKNCQETSCVITYVVSYKTAGDGKMKFSTETKKLAEFIKERDGWKISNVTNIKTFHESLESINPLED